MFTGIVQQIGRIVTAETTSNGAILQIDPQSWDHHPTPGDSIAVNGCCLTVVATGPPLSFDVIAETLRMTTLGSLRPGDLVNLEHAATPDTLMGGHLVQGHIDAVGIARRIQLPHNNATQAHINHDSDDPDEWRLRIEAPEHLMPLLSPKGSITIDGVSLTIAALSETHKEAWFDICLIPTTLSRTTLSRIGQPTPVNLESDCIARMVARQFALTRA